MWRTVGTSGLYGMAELMWAKFSPCFAMALELEGIFFWIIICIVVYGPDDSTKLRIIWGMAMAHHGICYLMVNIWLEKHMKPAASHVWGRFVRVHTSAYSTTLLVAFFLFLHFFLSSYWWITM